MNGLKRFFRLHGNKFFAIFFASLAFAFFIAYILLMEVSTQWHFFQTADFLSWIEVLFTVSCLLVLLVTNIRNSNNAYLGILWFLLSLALDLAAEFSSSFRILILYPDAVMSVETALSWLGGLAAIGAAGICVVLWIWALRYRIGRTNNYGLIRILSLCLIPALALFDGLRLAYFVLLGSSPVLILSILFFYLSEIATVVCIVFTFRRLRRF